MPIFPFFKYPYFNNYYGYNYYNKLNSNYYKNNTNNNQINYNKNEQLILDNKKSENNDSSDSEHVFEVFGIKLYFDDVLIISLLILLYNEGVKDYSLFISLILLLIS